MIELDNQTSAEVDTAPLEAIAESLSDREIELVIVDDAAMCEINREHRGIDASTDVLSFPFEAMPMAPLGSVVISMDYVRRGAERFGHTPADECALLFIHGMLHLLGYDHETDSGEMRERERELIGQFGLPQSLIVRTEEG
jgi:probable rRNA maturation factor